MKLKMRRIIVAVEMEHLIDQNDGTVSHRYY